MTGTITCKVDTSVFNLMMATLREIVPQDAEEFLRDETARLAEECARQLSMRSSRNKGGLDKDIKSVFSPMPKNMLPAKNQHGTQGMRWLSAGPENLTGVKEFRFHDTDSAEDMLKLFYKSKGALPSERRTELGVHGQSHRWNFRTKKRFGAQRVFEINRVVVKRAALAEFRRNLKARFGRLEASFALTAKILRGNSAKVKAYISRHLNGEALPNITDLTGLENKISPRTEFGSFAPGVEGFEDEINSALAVRVEKMEKRGQRILNAYAKQISAGQVPAVFAKQSAED